MTSNARRMLCRVSVFSLAVFTSLIRNYLPITPPEEECQPEKWNLGPVGKVINNYP